MAVKAWLLALGLFATEPLPAAGTETVRIHFAIPKSASIADQYVNTGVLAALLQDKAKKLPNVKPCWVSLLTSEQFSSLDLTASHVSRTQRVDCLRGIISYLLHSSFGEVEFLSARKSRAEFTRNLTDPQPRFERFANRAAERLAYMAIYEQRSPLHRLHSVTERDVTELSFGTFNLWLLRSREEKLINFDGESGLMELLGLPAKIPIELIGSISLSSPRSPPGILFFGGERFGVPALLMLPVRADYASQGLSRSDAWKRFSCNQGIHSHVSDDGAPHAISSIICFAHFVFGDSWVGWAIRKSDEFGYSDFCDEVIALANAAEIVALVRHGTEGSGGLYVLLPSKCERDK
jgi:hypothetical protein